MTDPIDLGRELRALEAELGVKKTDELLDITTELYSRFAARFQTAHGRPPTQVEWESHAAAMLKKASGG